MADQINAGDPIYDGTSDLYGRGDVVLHPPSAPDFGGLPARPLSDALRDIRVDSHNREAELGVARQQRARYAAHLASLDIERLSGEESEDVQAGLARLAALDLEAEMLGDQFPTAHAKEQGELRERLETTPARLAALLQAKVDLEAGREEGLKAEIASHQERLKQLETVEGLYQRREIEHAARRVHWGVGDEGDLRRLRDAGVDLDRIPKRLQPSR